MIAVTARIDPLTIAPTMKETSGSWACRSSTRSGPRA